MHRLTAIFFLLLFLFNIAGYRVFFAFLKQQNDTQFAKVIDREEYDEKDLFTITVDLNMPYQTGHSPSTPVNGEIEINGKVYKFVKRSVQQGRMILVCVADAAKTNLVRAEQQLSDFSQDLPTKNSHTTNTLLKILVTDYDNEGSYLFSAHSFTGCIDRVTHDENVPVFLFAETLNHPPNIATC